MASYTDAGQLNGPTMDTSVLGKIQFVKTVLNSLFVNSAILDSEGIIRLTNVAWSEFGRQNDLRIQSDGVGADYVKVAESATGYSAEGAREVSSGLRRILNERATAFELDYPCHSQGEERWFRLRAAQLRGLGTLKVLVAHEDITEIRRSMKELAVREVQLEGYQRNLETVNMALKVLLNQREQDKRELEEKVLLNVKEQMIPIIEQLKRTGLNANQTQCLKTLEENIENIVSPFSYRLHSPHINLTPQEIRISRLIIDGLSTKEISDILCVSANAVEFHRKSIRKKLGIKNKRVSLRSRLLSLAPEMFDR